MNFDKKSQIYLQIYMISTSKNQFFHIFLYTLNRIKDENLGVSLLRQPEQLPKRVQLMETMIVFLRNSLFRAEY
ncbi:hypothetical protein C1752_12030 [Acaryochloris thomasi RCC1774]|uniref:Uncharacterized protein n=1 Tax=Acaryochloris thomasi RCC1774 TaxID=1764569 RepID=A0A2W1J7M3_9CYAN|nr:hypothetical protein [Acaryochloris thomasi]PZD70459.1 hypothetical protein C1752_12030 [Acaryochloris thomasi RCC1774]